jgi:hypothetical protein
MCDIVWNEKVNLITFSCEKIRRETRRLRLLPQQLNVSWEESLYVRARCLLYHFCSFIFRNRSFLLFSLLLGFIASYSVGMVRLLWKLLCNTWWARLLDATTARLYFYSCDALVWQKGGSFVWGLWGLWGCKQCNWKE